VILSSCLPPGSRLTRLAPHPFGIWLDPLLLRLPVGSEQLECEIQFARDGRDPGLDKYHVHIRCFAAWEFERNEPPA